MIKWIASFILLTWAGLAKAHQPAISSIILTEQAHQGWILQVRSPLTAFEYVIKQHYGEGAFATPEEFQELVVDYLMDNISIHINGQNKSLVLKNGFVQLGHDTNVVFQAEGIPETIETLVVNNPSFKGINRNQSIFMVLEEGKNNVQFILNDENQHTANLKIEENQFVQQEATLVFGLFQNQTIHSGLNYWVVSILTLLLLTYCIKKKRLLPVNIR